jgi:hypothetical protein
MDQLNQRLYDIGATSCLHDAEPISIKIWRQETNAHWRNSPELECVFVEIDFLLPDFEFIEIDGETFEVIRLTCADCWHISLETPYSDICDVYAHNEGMLMRIVLFQCDGNNIAFLCGAFEVQRIKQSECHKFESSGTFGLES